MGNMGCSAKKNTRKLRGHVSHGKGRVGKHRKHPGGHGLAGGQHHHRINFDKYHPGYFGKVGMRYFHYCADRHYAKAINTCDLWNLLPEGSMEKAKAATDGKVPVLDVTTKGYFKVLGTGRTP